ncbi:helix-turn-helix domain-containing protein [Bacillus subtilis]|uniref:helix-turn-helix domain-containing protein n=1 Tax=Bacillus subtilis TaxID=1423 RepID=UPI00338E9225
MVKKTKRKVTDADKKKMIDLFKQGLTMTKIADQIGCSRPTAINHLKKASLK